MDFEHTNDLIHETSPYLLQHAHNPVQWKPWNDAVLQKAQQEDKPLLISIGYAACHWCHVMEHESFEDTLVANIMNKHFVNIKVDREERPDIDQVYMNAIQLMRGNGGWPLNIVATPDGRPFWGVTYLPKEQWQQNLQQLSDVFKNNRDKVEEYADKLQQGMQTLEQVIPSEEPSVFDEKDLKESVARWATYFDRQMGGTNRAPKFMMPNNYEFLLRWSHQMKDEETADFVHLTLTKMAYGGVYDPIGGGFSRYAVDTKWHVPHFEKMLYDNAQLVSLYSKAYSDTQNPLYKEVVFETLRFVERELYDTTGAFYSSLDADSTDENGHLEEGAYYVWRPAQLKKLLGTHFEVFSDYYNINEYGFWENGNYVLIRKEDEATIAHRHNLSPEELTDIISACKAILFSEREKRPRPRLDDKSLTSWNALMIAGYLDAYKVFGEAHFLEVALKNARFILKSQKKANGSLFHSYKDGKSTINGYLEDYSTTIVAFLGLFEATSDVTWLEEAKALAEHTYENFYDETSQLFFFTAHEDTKLVTRNIEKSDNVIPASNSVLAKGLFKLGHLYTDKKYTDTARQMLNNMKQDALQYGSSHSNWLDLMLNFAAPYYEVVIVGDQAEALRHTFNQMYAPNILLLAANEATDLPLLKGRHVAGETLIYVCTNGTCQLPVKTVEEARLQIHN